MVDFGAEGLLDGLEGRERDARLRLLEALHADGADLDELRTAVAEDTLFLLPAERLIGGATRYTRREIAEKTGLDLAFLEELRRAQGLPTAEEDARVLAETDLQAARTVRTLTDAGLRHEDILEVTRILGRGLSHAAEAMRRMTLGLVLDPEADEHELAMRYARAAAEFEPLAAPVLGQMLNAHLRHAVRTELLQATEQATGELPGARDVAVCFADLVGFTRMGEEVPPDELGAVAERLERLAADVVELPVRMVKTIGDAVMLVSSEVDPLIEAALQLVEAADDEGTGFPQLRAGIAFGPALNRAGDWYGRPVNLASRLTALARPGSVLASEEVRELADDGWRWSFAGDRRVRGVRGTIKVNRVRRARGDDD
ncbi:adenylate/guanylate cyclase domain-containing protein [Capillimicrobium parvum]|uniref:PH-sensitive adenylate cyclase n=1 Tax=Capillimicrobium parvum TaxID=2884022 RepID=A0A9E6XZH8_9ACTN|nr:adenylate/guanylate cyclase domain-containing protein [Capillimicrobium parvum]UGS36832.1 pH-sensitive adenylate cyclase [Capillimicrobium parvum]